jgi:hypothetical protein
MENPQGAGKARSAIVMRGVVRAAACAVAFALLAGCSQTIVSSTPIPGGAENAPPTSDESVTAVYSLPMTVVTVSATPDATSTAANPKPSTYTITPSILPDNTARFRLNYVPTDLSDDSVTLGVDQNGLLSSVVANATGHQGDIIVALATTAATVATLGGAGLSGAMRAGAVPMVMSAPNPGCKPSVAFTVVYELKDLAGATEPLPDCSTFRVEWNSGAVASPAATVHPACAFSVCYRPLVTATATITLSGSSQIKQAKFVAIDPDSIEGLNLKSSPFVARTHTISFSSGLMTSAAISDPSVALAIANLPLTVLTAVLKAPQSVLTIQSTNIQDQTSAVTAQTALINAELALQKAVASEKTPTAVAGSGTAP